MSRTNRQLQTCVPPGLAVRAAARTDENQRLTARLPLTEERVRGKRHPGREDDAVKQGLRRPTQGPVAHRRCPCCQLRTDTLLT